MASQSSTSDRINSKKRNIRCVSESTTSTSMNIITNPFGIDPESVKSSPINNQWGHLSALSIPVPSILSQPPQSIVESSTDLDDVLLDDVSLDVLVSTLARETAAQFAHDTLPTRTDHDMNPKISDEENSEESDEESDNYDLESVPFRPSDINHSDSNANGIPVDNTRYQQEIPSGKKSCKLPPRPTTLARRSCDTKRVRRPCTYPECDKRSRSHGLCIAHGGGRRCAFDGCNKSSQGGDMCIKHGGGKRCKIDGCEKAAQTNFLCKGHGGGLRCQMEGCDRSSQGGGYCRTHGGGRRCAEPECMKGTQRGAYCALHGGARICVVDGCRRNDRGGGYCAHHGGGKRCSVDTCTRPSRRRGLCSTHLRTVEFTSSETSSGRSTPLSISPETSRESGKGNRNI